MCLLNTYVKHTGRHSLPLPLLHTHINILVCIYVYPNTRIHTLATNTTIIYHK